MIGAVIALISLSMIVFLFVISVIFDQGSSYLGLFVYIVLPVFLVAGLLLIPIGALIRLRKEKKQGSLPEKRWPAIDLNNPKHRNAFIIFAIGTCIFLFLSSVGSYEAFHYTESVEFCGTLCHKVMKPEYVAYQNSPHARVACVECHVGPGADWYVRSKLSGLYQVYAVTLGSYPRPIPTPIRNLRPARETCERCHWPEKFYARQLRVEKHYLADEQNTEWDIHLQVKTGPSYSALGLQEGIHWHINRKVNIEYIATDNQRESIPYVKFTDLETGESHEYMDTEYPLEEEAADTLETRLMDCMDCHNRPSHDYKIPEFFIDNALTAGTVPPELPWVKQIAMDVTRRFYGTEDSAMMEIDSVLNGFYGQEHPELYAREKTLVEQAVAGIQDEFKKNIFPEMKVRWDVYPNHIGHIQANGCFRCHDDRHVSQDGRVISRDCNLCHTIIAQGTPGSMEFAAINDSLEFRHPVDIGEVWKEYLCIDCHYSLY